MIEKYKESEDVNKLTIFQKVSEPSKKKKKNTWVLLCYSVKSDKSNAFFHWISVQFLNPTPIE